MSRARPPARSSGHRGLIATPVAFTAAKRPISPWAASRCWPRRQRCKAWLKRSAARRPLRPSSRGPCSRSRSSSWRRRGSTWGAAGWLRTRPSAFRLARRGAEATVTSSSWRASGGRRLRMLATRAWRSSAGQQSMRLSTSRIGLPACSIGSRASSSGLLRSPSSTNSSRSAPMATRAARRWRARAAISSMPGVSTSSTPPRPGTATGQATRCWWRVQPWATSVAKWGAPRSALSRLDLPTPTRPNTATRRRRSARAPSWRSRPTSSGASTDSSRPLSCSSARQRRSSWSQRSTTAGGS